MRDLERLAGAELKLERKTVRELIELALAHADEDGELPDSSPAVCVRRPEDPGKPVYPGRNVEELTKLVLEGWELTVRIAEGGRLGFFTLKPKGETVSVSYL